MDVNEKDENVLDNRVEEMVVVALRRIIRVIDLRSRYLVTQYGLTGPQLVLLKELSARDGDSVSKLTRAVHLSQATVTGILDRLEKRELVRRQRSDEDRRRVQIWLTDAGRELLAEAPTLLQEEFIDQLASLDDWEQTQILSSLQRVVSMMEAKHIDATPILTTGPVSATPENTAAFLTQQPENSESAGEDPMAPSEKGGAGLAEG